MNPSNQPAKPAINLQDVLFILARHKWKLIVCSILGCIAAGAIWHLEEPLYYSRAKLLVRYVTETRGVESGSAGDVIRSPEGRGNTLTSSEIEILSSLDALVETARIVGPGKVLANSGGGTNILQAAGQLRSGLEVGVGRGSGVINVGLGHSDPEVAQEGLRAIIAQYLKKHVEIHRAVGTYDFLQAQTDQLKARLAQLDEELRKEKAKVGVLSVEQAKTEVYDQYTSIRKAIMDTQTQIAEQKARLPSLETNGATVASASTNAPSGDGLQPTERLTAQRLFALLMTLQEKEIQAMNTYSESSAPMLQLRRQIDQTRENISKLGLDPDNPFPYIASSKNGSAKTAPVPLVEPQNPQLRLASLEARLAALTTESTNLFNRARAIEMIENSMSALQRQKEMDEEKLRYFYRNLERARIDQELDATKISNISIIQEPAPSGRDFTKRKKYAGIALAAGVGLGLALALLSEFVLDQTYRRPKEIEGTLQIPVFVSIPSFGMNGHSKLLKDVNGEPGAVVLANGEIPPWDENDPMLSYYEAIRDRVVMSYAGDAHKPKVVGLTSCSHGAGVSRLAAGVAAALSRDAERNVLFVGLERNKVSVTAFARGRPAAELGGASAQPQVLAEGAGNEGSSIHQCFDPNLLSLAATGRNLVGASIVQSFCDLMPKLRVSDYDYVIFDLPPIGQTSGAVRLAAQMERTLLVVEAEKTPKAAVQKAQKLLSSARANFAVVLNKAKPYGVES